MADLAVWQRTIVDEKGDIIPGAEVSVRSYPGGSLITLYEGPDGTQVKGNPFSTGADGFARFWAESQRAEIVAHGAGSTIRWIVDLINADEVIGDAVSEATAAAAVAVSEAEAAASRAEAARDAATVNAEVYANVALGLNATEVGDQFLVTSGPEIIRYRHDAGSVATEVATYPASSALGAINVAADWDALSVSGGYRAPTGGPAIGQPDIDTSLPFVVEHTEGLAGRAWQVAKISSGSTPRMWFRSKLASTWSDWVEVADKGSVDDLDDAVQGLSTALGATREAADWNALNVSGGYRAPTGSTAVGQPEASTPNMVVDHTEGLAGRAWQIARTTTSSTPRMWFRSRLSGNWSTWLEVEDKSTPVAPSRLGLRDWSNIFPDPNITDANLYSGASFSRPTSGAVPVARTSEQVLLTPLTADEVEVTTPIWPVEPGKPYYLSARLGRYTGVGALQSSLWVEWFSDWSGGELVSAQQIGSPVNATEPQTRSATLLAPADAVRARLVGRKSAGDNAHTFAMFDIIVRRAIDQSLLYEPVYTPPLVEAEGALCLYLGDGETEVLYEKAAASQLPPASLTKVLTAVTALRLAESRDIGPDYDLTLAASDLVGGSGNNLLEGDTITFADAIANMMLASSNSTATMVARTFGQILVDEEQAGNAIDRFIAEMNSVAGQIGMTSSQFNNATGLGSAGQTTTAQDIGALMVEALKYDAITSVWGLPEYEVTVTGPNARTEDITHSVPMIGDADVQGGKSGTITPSWFNAALHVSAPRGNQMIVVILKSTSTAARYADARRLIDAIANGFDWPVLKPTPRT